MVIGLTGGIASGKSLVAEYLRELAVPVIDTDEIARQVVTPGQPAWHRLREAFGAEFFLPDGQLDRAALGQHVFTDPAARGRLEGITHPAIFAEVDRQIALLTAQTPAPPLIVVAVPLLFEVGAAHRFAATVLVTSTPEQQRERLISSRGYTPEEAAARVAAQWPLARKLPLADYLLENSGSRETLRAQVIALVHRLSRQPE
ncbi:MAG TPA: dephospho-CoA kinase [Armatimonadota bacterium]|jgi:dephospho-CoA kinase